MSSAVPFDLDDGGAGTLVIEDGVIPRRVRRPIDLVRFAVALLAFAAIVAISYFLTATSTGIDQDIIDASGRLPELLRFVLNTIAGLGVLALPIAVALDLLIRRRGRQLVDAVGAMLIAAALCVLASFLVTSYAPDRLLVAITGDAGWQPHRRSTRSSPGSSRSSPSRGSSAAGAGARSRSSRSWPSRSCRSRRGARPRRSSGCRSRSGGRSASRPATRSARRPPARAGCRWPRRSTAPGLPITVLRANKNTARGRQYTAFTRDRERLRVNVYDRDLEGAGLAQAAWRQLRLRTDPANPSVFSMRAQLEHAALMSYAASAAGGRVPTLRAVVEVGPDSTLLAYDEVPGRTFAELDPGTVSDADLDEVFRAVRTLHDERIVHRALSPEQLIKADDGDVWLAGVQHGTIAASDVQERIDLAELLVHGGAAHRRAALGRHRSAHLRRRPPDPGAACAADDRALARHAASRARPARRCSSRCATSSSRCDRPRRRPSSSSCAG